MLADIVSGPITGNHTVFVSGPPGSGKTTLAVQRLLFLLNAGIPAEQILILVPQRTLAGPYYEALDSQLPPPGGQVDVATIGGLARRTIGLFWPLVARPAGFAQPELPPRFLTLETAQYLMHRVVEPFIGAGAFDGITIPRTRLASQIIDNLNKAAAVGFVPEEIAARLKGAWGGDSSRIRVYDQVQATALAFRRECLANNLLDWSLQIQVFWRSLLPLPELRRYLLSGYRHLVVDNTEEDIPAVHDLLRVWLSLCESALVLHDTGGGYRVFLGADPQGALSLGHACREHVALETSHISSASVVALAQTLVAPLAEDGRQAALVFDAEASEARRALVLPAAPLRFHPQMLDWVAEQASHLIMDEGLPPGEIALLAPFLGDALRFSLTERLHRYSIAVRTHRPSRQLREEPAARCLLTLARLAHPGWHRPPPAADVAQALGLAIADLDPVRARLLTDIVYHTRDGRPTLSPFYQIIAETKERITFLLGVRYDELWRWIQEYAEENEAHARDPQAERLDIFLSRLFGEVLSQPGFGFHRSYDAGAVAANLIESVQKFRKSLAAPMGGGPQLALGLEYVDMVERGVVAAQYVATWQIRPENAVLLVPAYTFLMANQPATVQFWLDAGSPAWFERIYQPLTHPYVLRREWVESQKWTDDDEVRVREEALARLLLGLSRRCRRSIYLAYSELSEQGYEQRGPLLQAVQRMLRRHEGSGR